MFVTLPRVHIYRALEAQGGHAGRGVQGLRPVSRGRHAGARDPSGRRHGHLRHGRPIIAANLAVHTTVCQAHRRLAAGRRAVAHQGYSHHQPAENLSGCVCAVQAVPAREVEEPHRVPRHRSCIVAQIHLGQLSAAPLWRNQPSSAHRR